MKIGILNCELININKDAKFPGYPEMFIESFKKNNSDFEFNIYSATSGELPGNVEACSGYIITGSYASVNDNDKWIDQLADFIRCCDKQKKKLVGICFGHQLISKALGGVVKKNDLGWNIGLQSNKILKQKTWMIPELKKFDMIMSHNDHVEAIPGNTEVIAFNERCANFMLQRGDTILSIQGHPEFNKDYCQSIMQQNKDDIPNENLESAYASFSGNPDNRTLIQWITNFLLS